MSRHQLNVYNLPHEVPEGDLVGSVAVVIDALRATSTICYALAAGAAEVVPLLEIEEARAAAEEIAIDGIGVVLGGEREGCRIPGFDLGNSPSEYTPSEVRGRLIVITTTNGTRALHHARLARRIVVGAFVNRAAVVASILNEPRVDILCAGTDGKATREDILAAGSIASGLIRAANSLYATNAAADTACREWDALVSRARSANRPIDEQLAVELRDTAGGRNLLEIGMDRDLVDCARIDRFDIAPELQSPAWRIALPGREKPLR